MTTRRQRLRQFEVNNGLKIKGKTFTETHTVRPKRTIYLSLKRDCRKRERARDGAAHEEKCFCAGNTGGFGRLQICLSQRFVKLSNAEDMC